MSELIDLLEPISLLVPELDLSDPESAEARLNEAFPADSESVACIAKAARAAVEAGEICQRGEPNMLWGRIAKPEDTPGGSSIDVVYMDNAKGPPHTHVSGEVCLCLPDAAGAAFEGRTDTWIVMARGSRHVPRVTDGRMLILYWWPGGEVEWG